MKSRRYDTVIKKHIIFVDFELGKLVHERWVEGTNTYDLEVDKLLSPLLSISYYLLG